MSEPTDKVEMDTWLEAEPGRRFGFEMALNMEKKVLATLDALWAMNDAKAALEEAGDGAGSDGQGAG